MDCRVLGVSERNQRRKSQDTTAVVQEVAVKIVRERASAENEAGMLDLLKHPHIVQVLGMVNK